MKLTNALSDKAVSVVSGLALAVKVVLLGEEEAVGVLVAERLLAVLDVAAVGAVLDAGGADLGGGGVGRALSAEGLLGLVLVAAARAGAALVQGRVEEGAGLADGQRAVALRVRARRGGREAVRAAFARQMEPLRPVEGSNKTECQIRHYILALQFA